jgi:hypothetical protein
MWVSKNRYEFFALGKELLAVGKLRKAIVINLN